MIIGIPKEIKNNENRVGLVPSGVRQFIHDGHQVYVETSAGIGIGISDKEYIKAGATILPSLEEVFAKAEMIIKVKEPQPREVALLKPHHILYTYLHLAASKEQDNSLRAQDPW
jgi:alanine dehydrogenase